MLIGVKTYLAALGLAMLGIAQILEGQVELGIQSLLAAAAAAGLRHAIATKPTDRRSLGILIAIGIITTTSTVNAQPPIAIQGETAYTAFSLVRLHAVQVDAKAGILWRVHPALGVQKATSPRGILEFAAPPGVYEVELLAISQDDGIIRVDEARSRVTIASVAPMPPMPMPPPDSPGGRLDPPKALGRIRFGNAGCTATIIGPRRSDGRWDVLTASHCMNGVGSRGTFVLQDGRSLNVRVQVHQRKADIAWLVTEDAHTQLPYANLSTSNPPVGTAVWHAGYGVDQPGNREDGQVSAIENSDGQLRFTLSVSSGDSGGGIFRADTNEVVSTVCCTSGLARKVSMWGGSAERAKQLRPTGAEELAPESPEPSEEVQRCDFRPIERQNPILWLHSTCGWGQADEREYGHLTRIHPMLWLPRE